MKQNIAIIALLAGAISSTEAIRISSQKTLDEFKEMVSDPDYADTWKYTESEGNWNRMHYRYVN